MSNAHPPRVVDPDVSPDQRTYATFMHLMLVIATVTVVPMVLGPLVMWLIKRRESAFINDHGKEALNFNLTVIIYAIILGLGGLLTCGLGWYLLPVLWIGAMVISIVAAVSANRGEYYRYPACIRLIA